MNFLNLFNKQKNIVIGAVHLPPLPGHDGFPGFDIAIQNAIADTKALEEGGADGIIFENNYDIPHVTNVPPHILAAMTRIGAEIRNATKLPVGVSVLWNDYRAALAIAQTLGLQFIRIPVFVDDVETQYGVVHGDATDVTQYRHSIGASHICLVTDVHVKHAKILNADTIAVSAKKAVAAGADALIVTGEWTGSSPSHADLIAVREAVGDFPVMCGSGVDAKNAKTLFSWANGAIVSTSLKNSSGMQHRENIHNYEARIDRKKVCELVESFLQTPSLPRVTLGNISPYSIR